MTVSTTANRNTFTGDGVMTVFPFTFTVQQATDIDIYLDEVLTVSGYTVAINSSGVGGTITFSAAPALDVEGLIYRDVPYTQQTALPIESNLPETVLEQAYDKLTMLCQQLKEITDRSITLPITTLLTGLVFPDAEADMLIGWNAAGTALENTAGTPGPQGDPGSLTGPATTVVGNVPVFADTVGGLVSDSGVAISGLGTWVLAALKSGTWANDTAGSNVSYPVDATSATICNLVAATGSGKVSRFAITTGSGGLTINRNGSDTIDYLGTSTTVITMARTTSGVLDLQDVAAGLWRVV